MKPALEAAARALHEHVRTFRPYLPAWDDTSAEAREQYATVVRVVVRAHKAAKRAEKAR